MSLNDNLLTKDELYSLIVVFLLSFIGGLINIKYEILLKKEEFKEPFKFIVMIKTIEEFYKVSEILLICGMVSSLVLLISRTIRKKIILIIICVLNLLIFVSIYFITSSYYSLLISFSVGLLISLTKMMVPLYIQNLFEHHDSSILILINFLFINFGLLLGETLLVFDFLIIGLCLISLILNIYTIDIRNCHLKECKIVNNHKAWLSIILTILYEISGSLLEINPKKLDQLYYSRAIAMILVNITAVEIWGRNLFLITSNLLTMIFLGIRMTLGETPGVRSLLIWSYTGGLYTIKELFFIDFYPPKFSEYGMFVKYGSEIFSRLIFFNSNWNYKKSFIASFILLLISTLLYKEPCLIKERDKIWE